MMQTIIKIKLINLKKNLNLRFKIIQLFAKIIILIILNLKLLFIILILAYKLLNKKIGALIL